MVNKTEDEYYGQSPKVGDNTFGFLWMFYRLTGKNRGSCFDVFGYLAYATNA
jgi:hypothetical protein